MDIANGRITSRTRKDPKRSTQERIDISIEPMAPCKNCSGRQVRYRQAPLIQIGADDVSDTWVGRIVMILYMAMSLSQTIAAFFSAG